MSASERTPLSGRLARLNAISFALVFGTVVGGTLWLATVVLLVKGGVRVGANLGLLNQYFPGYSVTIPGAFIGFLWAFATGFVLSLPSAWLYYRGVLRRIERSPGEARDEDILAELAPIEVPHFAAAFALLCGFSVLLATVWLVIRHQPDQPLGPHLILLAQYLPGFRVSLAGGLLGFVYASLIGGAVFVCVGRLYNRLVFGRSRLISKGARA